MIVFAWALVGRNWPTIALLTATPVNQLLSFTKPSPRIPHKTEKLPRPTRWQIRNPINRKRNTLGHFCLDTARHNNACEADAVAESVCQSDSEVNALARQPGPRNRTHNRPGGRLCTAAVNARGLLNTPSRANTWEGRSTQHLTTGPFLFAPRLLRIRRQCRRVTGLQRNRSRGGQSRLPSGHRCRVAGRRHQHRKVRLAVVTDSLAIGNS
mmetsp:Transcript_78514/g.209789  ORF Transcript_78514/g.209789 Transcript_78514/m.209789 type:complete len:211 (-) Transcript_78514:105-737(-)